MSDTSAAEMTLDEKAAHINLIAERLRTTESVTDEEVGEVTRMNREIRAEMASSKKAKKAPVQAFTADDFA